MTFFVLPTACNYLLLSSLSMALCQLLTAFFVSIFVAFYFNSLQLSFVNFLTSLVNLQFFCEILVFFVNFLKISYVNLFVTPILLMSRARVLFLLFSFLFQLPPFLSTAFKVLCQPLIKSFVNRL